jgi:hypothetical protein
MWKAVEQRVAEYIGGKRVPVTGRTRGDAPDIEHNWLCPEVKYKQKLPNWIHDAMDQAVKSARPRQLPCVFLCEKGKSVGDYYMVVRAKDAKDWWL